MFLHSLLIGSNLGMFRYFFCVHAIFISLVKRIIFKKCIHLCLTNGFAKSWSRFFLMSGSNAMTIVSSLHFPVTTATRAGHVDQFSEKDFDDNCTGLKGALLGRVFENRIIIDGCLMKHTCTNEEEQHGKWIISFSSTGWVVTQDLTRGKQIFSFMNHTDQNYAPKGSASNRETGDSFSVHLLKADADTSAIWIDFHI